MKTKKIAVKELVEDLALYPRALVDGTHVSHLADAINAGSELPPPVVCSKTNKIVDGFHRIRAWRRIYGEDSSILVIVRHYDSDADLFKDAMHLNSAHGKRMSAYDQTRSALKAMELGLTKDQVAAAMKLSITKLDEIVRVKVGESPITGAGVVLKSCVSHMTGRPLTPAQENIMPRLGGQNQLFYVNQIIHLLETGMMDLERESVVQRLQVLRSLLSGITETVKAA